MSDRWAWDVTSVYGVSALVHPRAVAPASRITHPADDGCAFSPTCFTCPLPACWHEMGMKQAHAWLLARRVVELDAQGMTNAAIAAEMGLSKRSVSRFRAAARLQGQRKQATP